MSKDIDFQLAEQEAILLKQHLNRIIQLDRQISDLRRKLAAERDVFEMVWQNAYRRNLLERVEQGKILEREDLQVPQAIENGELKIVITEERKVRVVRNG